MSTKIIELKRDARVKNESSPSFLTRSPLVAIEPFMLSMTNMKIHRMFHVRVILVTHTTLTNQRFSFGHHYQYNRIHMQVSKHACMHMSKREQVSESQ